MKMKKRNKKLHKHSRHGPDRALLITLFIILGLGLVILSSASLIISQEHFDNSYHYFFHQLIYGVGIGLVVFFITQKVHYGFWKKWAWLALPLSIGALILVFIPGLGFGNGGAKRWIEIGAITFQPSELVKLGLIIYLAAWLEKRKDNIKSFSHSTLPFLLILGLLAGFFIAQPDIGTLGVVIAIALTMFFLAGASWGHIGLIFLGGAASFFTLVKLAPYRMNRFLVFLNPEIDPLGIGYQMKQALLAIGSGGLFGVGLVHSRQKYSYLPSPATDSIFAIAAEEIGFIGAVLIVILFVFLAIRGLKIAKKTSDKFGQLLAAGITSWFIIQAFVNIGAITGLIPLTGITLPFISYGSSSMIVSLAGMGILFNISKYTT